MKILFADQPDSQGTQIGIGALFSSSKSPGRWLLVSAGPDSVILVNRSTGERWVDSVEVKNECWLTQDEWHQITGGADRFTMIRADAGVSH